MIESGHLYRFYANFCLTVVLGQAVPRTRGPRTSCPPGHAVLGPRVPLGQLILGAAVPHQDHVSPLGLAVLGRDVP